MAANDTQIGGDHYRNKQYQPWDVMRDWMTPEMYCGFLLGAVIKYVARYRSKSGLEDLKKARHFLDKLIESESGWRPKQGPKAQNTPLVVPSLDHPTLRCACYNYGVAQASCAAHSNSSFDDAADIHDRF